MWLSSSARLPMLLDVVESSCETFQGLHFGNGAFRGTMLQDAAQTFGQILRGQGRHGPGHGDLLIGLPRLQASVSIIRSESNMHPCAFPRSAPSPWAPTGCCWPSLLRRHGPGQEAAGEAGRPGTGGPGHRHAHQYNTEFTNQILEKNFNSQLGSIQYFPIPVSKHESEGEIYEMIPNDILAFEKEMVMRQEDILFFIK